MIDIIVNHSDNSCYQLSLDNLSLQIGDRLLFDSVSFSCCYGNILLIKGAVGCGKSTLLKLLSGIYLPTSGEVRNKSISTGEPIESIYIHSQAEFNFITGYVKDELRFADIDESSFTDMLSKSVYDLSGGELKKLSIHMALRSFDSGVILLDEPLDMLDDIEAENLANLIIDESKKRPFIISTHDNHFDKVADIILSFK